MWVGVLRGRAGNRSASGSERARLDERVNYADSLRRALAGLRGIRCRSSVTDETDSRYARWPAGLLGMCVGVGGCGRLDEGIFCSLVLPFSCFNSLMLY